jgi:hypothetical protein
MCRLPPNAVMRFERPVRALLGGLLMVAGFEKLARDPEAVAQTVVGRYVDRPLHIAALGGAEALLGSWIVLTFRTRLAFGAATWTFSTFSLALWRHVEAGDPISCGCLGASFSPAGEGGEVAELLWSAWRTTGLAVGSALCWLASARPPKPGPPPPLPASPTVEVSHGITV